MGVGNERFPAHQLRSQFHNWEWLRGVVLPGDRGMGVSHYVTFHVTLGRCLFMNFLSLSSYKYSPHPQYL